MRNEMKSRAGLGIRKYPIGLQSFREIREGGYLYIDKTEIIHRLVDTGKYYFLSRPRRFGKSLLVDTIEQLFSGRKELFEGLWMYDRWDWTRTNPVIKLRISKIPYQKLGLYDALFKELDALAAPFGIELTETDLKSKFWELIEKASTIGKVVILIDEYDKPIIDYLDDLEKVEENRSVFKQFYSVLKDADPYIHLLLLTGVSRFSKVSVFSDLNNLRDITLSPAFVSIAGITQQEMEQAFAAEINEMQQQQPDILERIREWYNGYTWDGTTHLYNPFSLLNYFADRLFNNFWIDTGTPTFLIKAVQQHPDRYIMSTDTLETGLETLKDLNIGDPDPISMLFQTGFLTIKAVDWEMQLVTLGYPNREVKQSVLTFITAAYTHEHPGQLQPVINQLSRAFLRNDIAQVITIFDTLFVRIPNPLWTHAKEQFYHGIIFNTFQLLGIWQESEVFNAHGRSDIIVKTSTHIFALEFKLDKSAHEAIDQIFDREYLKPFRLDTRRKVAVGINFSSAKKAVAEYEVKEL